MKRNIVMTLAFATAASSAAASSGSTSSAAAGIPGAASRAGDNSASAAAHESSASFTGRNGLMRVDGNTIEARNGELRVNGIPYGKVTGASVVKYTVSGDKSTLTVNGVPRAPMPRDQH